MITYYPKQGYSMGLDGEEFRTFTGRGLALLKELLRTHPNRDAVTLLSRGEKQASECARARPFSRTRFPNRE